MKFLGWLGFFSAISGAWKTFMRILLVAMQIVGFAAAAVILVLLALGGAVYSDALHVKFLSSTVDEFAKLFGGSQDAQSEGWAIYMVIMIVVSWLVIKGAVVGTYISMAVFKMSDEELAANRWTLCAASFDIAGLYMPFFLMGFMDRNAKGNQTLRPKVWISRVISLELAISSLVGIIAYFAVMASVKSKVSDGGVTVAQTIGAFPADHIAKSISIAVMVISLVVFAASTAFTVLYFMPNADEDYFKKNTKGVFMQIWADVLCIFITLEWIVMMAIGLLLFVYNVYKAWKRTKGHWYSPWRWIKTIFWAILYLVVYFVWAAMIIRSIYGMWRNNMSAPDQAVDAIESESQAEGVFASTKPNKINA